MSDQPQRWLRPEPGAVYVPPLAQLAADRMAAGHNPSPGALTPVPAADRVDTRTATDLVDLVRDLVAAAAQPTLTGPERLTRLGRASDACRDIRDALHAWRPYAPTSGHTRVADVLIATGARDTHGGTILDGDRAAAANRLELDRQARTLALATRAWAGFDALVDPAHARPTTDPLPPSPAAWLNSASVAPASGDLGPGRLAPLTWAQIPTAFLDPDTGQDISETQAALLEGDPLGWHTAVLATDVSHELLDWTVSGAQAIETMLQAAVDTRLEAAIITDLTTGAPTATSLAQAEATVSAAWAPGPDLILTAGTDRPAVVRAYAADLPDASTWPTILGTAGVPAGTAIIMATPLVHAEASAIDWMLAEAPRHYGQDIAAFRYGLGYVRQPGAVAVLTLAAA